jgi:hypothetical protein
MALRQLSALLARLLPDLQISVDFGGPAYAQKIQYVCGLRFPHGARTIIFAHVRTQAVQLCFRRGC